MGFFQSESSQDIANNIKLTFQQEGVTKTIDLSSSDQPFEIEYMMRYFYVLDYPESESPDMQLYIHASMYSTADKYDVPDLRQIALTKFTY